MRFAKIVASLTWSTVLFTISLSNSALGGQENFTCEGLARYRLAQYNAECLQDIPILPGRSSNSTQTGDTEEISIRRHGVLTVNGGEPYDVTNIQVYEDGIEASLAEGSVSFVSEAGIEQNGNRIMRIRQVILRLNGGEEMYAVTDKGSCTSQSLRNPSSLGRFIAFASPNKYTS